MKKWIKFIILVVLIIIVICFATWYITSKQEINREELAKIERINTIRKKEVIIPTNMEKIDEQKIMAMGTYFDGMMNYNPTTEEYVMVRTVGTVKVDKIIKGDLKEDELPFVRLGGILPLKEYIKTQPQAHAEKMGWTSLSDEEKETRYVKDKISGDIDIEANKTYLMYLFYSTDYERYSIQFYQYGLREIETDSTIDTQSIVESNTKTLRKEDFSNIKVLNNTDGSLDSLSSILPKDYIK